MTVEHSNHLRRCISYEELGDFPAMLVFREQNPIPRPCLELARWPGNLDFGKSTRGGASGVTEGLDIGHVDMISRG